MRTNRAPYDYQRKVIIKSQPQRLCTLCGSYIVPNKDEILACLKCKCTTWEWVQQSESAEYRNQLALRNSIVAEMGEKVLSVLDMMQYIDVTPAPLFTEPADRKDEADAVCEKCEGTYMNKKISTVDVSAYFGGIKATASKSWADRHLNNGGK